MKLSSITESLLQEKHEESAYSFSLNELADEIKKRKEIANNLWDKRFEVDPHYKAKYDMYVDMVKKRLNKPDLVNLSDERDIRKFFDDIDFYLRHAEQLIGLPG